MGYPKTLGEIVEQVHRPYYDLHLRPFDKSKLLISHFETMSDAFGLAISNDLVSKKQLFLTEFHGKSNHQYQVTLSQNEKFNREGNLTFSLLVDGEILLRLAFSINKTENSNEILIGCIQSTRNDPLSRLRSTTHDLYGIQPRILLINLVRLLSNRFGFTSIEAISSQNHVFQIRRYRHKFIIHMNYDNLWTLVGGILKPNGNYLIPIEIPKKPIESYPSNKRSEHKHRNQLMSGIEADLNQFFTSRLDS